MIVIATSENPIYLFKPNSNFSLQDSESEAQSKVRTLEIDMIATMWSKFGLRHHLASEAEVGIAIGQLFNNAKSLEAPGHNGSGLYGRYCMLNHCCVSNAKCIINNANGTFPLEVRAQTKIQRGDEITTRYVKVIFGADHDISTSVWLVFRSKNVFPWHPRYEVNTDLCHVSKL